MNEEAKLGGMRFPRKLWIPIVLITGLIIGELLSFASAQPHRPGPGPGPFSRFPSPFPQGPLFGLHIVLTTVEVALIVSLLAIYVKTYMETRARFSLGLVVVLGAFLLETLLTYPLVAAFLGPVAFGPGFSSSFDDVVTVCAYTIFLYLSLG